MVQPKAASLEHRLFIADSVRTSRYATGCIGKRGSVSHLVSKSMALLRDSLQLDIWEGAADVRTLYEFVINALVHSNLHKDRSSFEVATEVIGP